MLQTNQYSVDGHMLRNREKNPPLQIKHILRPWVSGSHYQYGRAERPVTDFENSDTGPTGVYLGTCRHSSAIPPVDYRTLSQGQGLARTHSMIEETQSTTSSEERKVFSYMDNNPEEMALQLAREEQAQQEQSKKIHM